MRPYTNANEKVFNCKVVDITEIYNFGYDRFSIRGRLKILNFECEKFKRNFPWLDDFKREKLSTTKLYNSSISKLFLN